jgi:hypothetical protein
MVHSPGQFRSLICRYFRVQWYTQWLINSYGSEGSKEVGTKPLEALKRLGHEKLKLNEYESEFALSRPRLQALTYLRRANCIRGYPPR